jgi:hypothetical protein
MTRLLSQLDAGDGGHRSRRLHVPGERLRSIAVVLGTVALLLVAWKLNKPTGQFPAAYGPGDDISIAPAGPVAPGLARPHEVVTDDGAYRFRFVRTSDGSPVTYDPCRPVRLVVNPSGGPPDGNDLIAEAIREVEEASGFDLQVVGETDERPRSGRPLGDRATGWAPALIAWSDPAETPGLEGDAAGLGGSQYAREGDEVAYISGSVTLDAPQLVDGPLYDRDGVRGVVIHELAHLLGLEHVTDASQLMYPRGTPGITSLQDGDEAGLAALGAVDCVG